MKRFYDFLLDESDVFHLEGTGQSHSLGSSRRGKRCAMRQQELKGQYRYLTTNLSDPRPTLQHMVHSFHDAGERHLSRDRLLGKKTDDDRRKEFEELSHIRDSARTTDLSDTLEEVVRILHDKDDVHRKFLKTVVEPLGNLEIARRLHLEYVEGTPLDHDAENRKSGIYVQPSFRHDVEGGLIYPRLRGVRALITDILVNSAQPLIQGLDEFDVNWEYLVNHAIILDQMYRRYCWKPENDPCILEEIERYQNFLTGAKSPELRFLTWVSMDSGILRLHVADCSHAFIPTWHEPLKEDSMVSLGPDEQTTFFKDR